MWYTTLIIIFFHHIVIFFQRLFLLIKIAFMKNTRVVYFKGSMLSSSVKGDTPDLGVLKGDTLLFYKFLTYPKRFSMLWFKSSRELLVIRKYYMLGYPRAIDPDQRKLPFTYNKESFHQKLSTLIQQHNLSIEYRYVFTPIHLGVKLDDSFIGNHDQVFDHISLINNKMILEELNAINSYEPTNYKDIKKILALASQ
jgi:hypothetical protein